MDSLNFFETPLLLITFNRPDHVRTLMTEIRKQKPTELYISQDGPREGNYSDLEKILKVRSIISDMVDWTCNLHTLYQEKNLGCGPGPAAAISWFFDNVDKGIIIEDDAIPHPEFFSYAEEMLNRYEDDSSVMAIGSMNVDRHKWGDGSYYFSRMNRNLCAWATWKRAWNLTDLKMKDVSLCQLNKALKYYGCGVIEREYWKDRLREIHKDGAGNASWDMQFVMNIWLCHGKGIIPNVNLSSNIGTVGEATHPMQKGNIIENVPTFPIFPLKHPTDMTIQKFADTDFHFRYFEPYKENWGKAVIIKNILNKRIKHLVGHSGPWIKR